jgi:hypothetical protein
VVRRASQPDVVVNAKIELIQCASHRRDQHGVERVRAGVQGQLDTMHPNLQTDIYHKAGIGSARVGNMTRANQLLDEALAVAGANGLHEFEFRIERIKQELGDGAEAAELQPYAVTEPVVQNAALREVSASLALLEV